jgi:fumarate hydratase class II
MGFREEVDSMGTVKVPEDAYYGAQTQRAIENFPISGLTFQPVFIKAVALIKKHAAQINQECGLLPLDVSMAIVQAAQEVMDGTFDDQFAVDVFQTGSGTSTNMNVNEVIAGRANEIITGNIGGKSPVHPNDHVNLGQSSNDVIPSAIHISAFISIKNRLLPALQNLHESLKNKADEFKDIVKIGRTHLQDAVPVTLGQEFGGYARQVELAIERLHSIEPRLAELALGGTAVGTGMNTHPEFARRVIACIAQETGCPFVEAKNHFEAQAAQDAAVETSAVLKTVAVSLTKIANDIRWLASGPRCGIGEIVLPDLQPGSSIMPGKVNPVMPEVILQVAAQVIGNDAAISIGGQAGNFELNTMLPLIAYNLLQSIEMLASAVNVFTEKCVDGIIANKEKCAATVDKSIALVTTLVPLIGYDKAAALAKEAWETGTTVREIALKRNILAEEELNKLFEKVHEH